MNDKIISILFVCYGNICRSPTAEFITKDLVKKRGLENDFIICSAATSTDQVNPDGTGGKPVYPPAAAEMAKHGIDCSEKRAALLIKNDYGKYDFIIGMDDLNIHDMTKLFGGDPDGKLHKLSEYAKRNGDIADPWFSRRFDIAFREIFEGCSGLIAHLDGR